jgi:hypothetical protein
MAAFNCPVGALLPGSAAPPHPGHHAGASVHRGFHLQARDFCEALLDRSPLGVVGHGELFAEIIHHALLHHLLDLLRIHILPVRPRRRRLLLSEEVSTGENQREG